MPVTLTNRRARTDDGLTRRMDTITRLGRLREQYFISRNKEGLLSLVKEYNDMGMVRTAKEVAREVNQI